MKFFLISIVFCLSVVNCKGDVWPDGADDDIHNFVSRSAHLKHEMFSKVLLQLLQKNHPGRLFFVGSNSNSAASYPATNVKKYYRDRIGRSWFVILIPKDKNVKSKIQHCIINQPLRGDACFAVKGQVSRCIDGTLRAADIICTKDGNDLQYWWSTTVNTSVA